MTVWKAALLPPLTGIDHEDDGVGMALTKVADPTVIVLVVMPMVKFEGLMSMVPCCGCW